MHYPLAKMNGLGNDFLIVTDEQGTFAPEPETVRRLADRAGDGGCDQLIALGPADDADVRMRIWNADGSTARHCGNATRCVGWLVSEASGRREAAIATPSGRVSARRDGDRQVMVDMQAPRLNWREIPLARATDTRKSDVRFDPRLGPPGFVSMGNPHAVFFIPHVDDLPIETLGPRIETDPLFPEGVNVGFAQVLSPERIRLRVWERGAGLTRACGTGACAALVAAHRRGLTGQAASVVLDGGELHIDWTGADGHVRMSGPVSLEFTGRLEV
ncbi:MAG TPA: diaminopimelate epimerase [Caulobacteraceae bacterium]|jgi:diaminopimelate epimerase|nr:diaminopimelate epimerase [Caulobacteraceae bacterium]